MKTVRTMFLMVAGFLTGGVVFAQSPDASHDAEANEDAELSKWLDRLDAQIRSISDLTSDFVEEKYTALLKEPMVSRGRVFVKGGRMRWSTISPTESTLYVDESRVALYFPARHTLEVYPLDHRLRSLVVSPIPRIDVLRRHWLIRPMAVESAHDERDRDRESSEGVQHLRLTPRDQAMSELLAEVRVIVNQRTGLANHVEMVDPDGERTVLTFSHTRTNVGLTDADVACDIPPGTKIVEPLGRTPRDGSPPNTDEP